MSIQIMRITPKVWTNLSGKAKRQIKQFGVSKGIGRKTIFWNTIKSEMQFRKMNNEISMIEEELQEIKENWENL